MLDKFQISCTPYLPKVALLLGLLALVGKLVVLVVALAALETAIAKLRLFRVPELLAGSFALGVLSVSAVVLLR